MILDKEYPATHSMSTAWYIVDEDGNVGIMDFDENGPVPWMAEEEKPFQSPDCILECRRPTKFCSVSWDKRVNSCSFAGGKERLETLDFAGLTRALSKVVFESCCKY